MVPHVHEVSHKKVQSTVKRYGMFTIFTILFVLLSFCCLQFQRTRTLSCPVLPAPLRTSHAPKKTYTEILEEFSVMLKAELQQMEDFCLGTKGRPLNPEEYAMIVQGLKNKFDARKHELALEAWADWKKKMEELRYTIGMVNVIDPFIESQIISQNDRA